MKKKLGWFLGAVVALFSAVLASLNPETAQTVLGHLSDSAQNQFTKNLLLFSLAAFIHSGRMKKEIRTNFELLVTSIDNVSKALKEDLTRQGEVLSKQGERLNGLTNRVESLESTLKKGE